MATRCAYAAREIGNLYDSPLFEEKVFAFDWSPGMSRVVKEARIRALHESIRAEYPTARILEVSTKSSSPLGVGLSAFNLRLPPAFGGGILESTYQSAKVYQNRQGDLFTQQGLAALAPVLAKKGNSLHSDLTLAFFDFNGNQWPANPGSLFYDFLFWVAIWEQPNSVSQLGEFDFFTDIEFNKSALGFQEGKSFNSQAKSCALVKTLFPLWPSDWTGKDAEVWFLQRSDVDAEPRDSFLF